MASQDEASGWRFGMESWKMESLDEELLWVGWKESMDGESGWQVRMRCQDGDLGWRVAMGGLERENG